MTTTPTAEGGDMDDDRDYAQEDADAMAESALDDGDDHTADELPEKVELSDEEALKGPSEFDPDRYMRIRVNANVNGVIKRGDELTVERDHPFYAGLLKQKLVEEIG